MLGTNIGINIHHEKYEHGKSEKIVVVVVVAATARLGAEQSTGYAEKRLEGLKLLFPSLAHLPVRAWSKVSACQ